jgi:hypothetical protein
VQLDTPTGLLVGLREMNGGLVVAVPGEADAHAALSLAKTLTAVKAVRVRS